MSNYNKAITYQSKWSSRVFYFTRKDKRSYNRFIYGGCSCRRQLKWVTNRKIRNYSGEIQSGGWYKRFDDPWSYD